MELNAHNAVLAAVLKDITDNTDRNRFEQLFIKLAGAVRPQRRVSATEKFSFLLHQVRTDRNLKASLKQLITGLLNQKDCTSLFTRVGLLRSAGFFPELFRQVKHRILPPLPEKRSLEYVIRLAFNRRRDYVWIKGMPEEMWVQLFRELSFNLRRDAPRLGDYLTDAVMVLSYRVSSLGLEEDIHRRITSDESLFSPFLDQNATILQLIQAFRDNDMNLVNTLSIHAIRQLNTCVGLLQTIRQDSLRYGTSLTQTYLLVRTEQQIRRILHIISLLRSDVEEDIGTRGSVDFFRNIIESENKRNSFRELMHQNAGLVAYQIAEHKGNTGEHYITSNRREYFRMLLSAAGGGAIISFIALFKTLLHHMDTAPFWEYFLYGLNYATGFILLQITHTTLATKQPAMTASTLASYMDTRKHQQHSLHNVARSFMLVWRSQTASFIGNLIVVFPLSLALAHLYALTFGHPLTGADESQQYLNAQNPVASPALFFAGVTGIFLFLSGIISGYVDNMVRFRSIPARIRVHPGLKKLFRQPRLNRIGEYIDENLGGFAGNIFLGFALGFAPLIGKSLGIPFDIRHITISTANFAFGLQGLDYRTGLTELLLVITGVLGIGFINFMVSFGLAFQVALRSRGVEIHSYRKLMRIVLRNFIRNPFRFFLPPFREKRATSKGGTTDGKNISKKQEK